MEVEDEARLSSIHLTAMEWHRDKGLLSDAVRHAFAADCPLVAADLLEMASRQRRRLGRIGSDASWSSHLSSEAFESLPQLHVEAACSFATRFELEAARAHLSNAREHFSNLEPVIRDDLYAVDAMIAIYGDRRTYFLHPLGRCPDQERQRRIGKPAQTQGSKGHQRCGVSV